MATVPEYTGDVPRRTQSQTDFNQNVQDILDYQVTLAPAINTVAGEVNTNATNAATSESNAATSETNAQTAATESAASANATVYDNATTYNYPDTVIGSDGKTYRCIGTGVVGDNPVGSVSTNWTKTNITQSPLMSSSVLGNPDDSLSISGGDLVITAGVFNYTGKPNEKGYPLSSTIVTETLDATSISDGDWWVSKNKDKTTTWFDSKPSYAFSITGVAFKDGEWYEDNVLLDPQPSFIPFVITVLSGEVQYLGDEEIAQNYTDSLAVKKLEVLGGFDLGQTRQDVSGERASGIGYLNTTGKPIDITIGILDSANLLAFTVFIDNTQIANTTLRTTTDAIANSFSFKVNPDEEYIVNIVSGTVAYWTEVR